jgi:hypothetical protein
MGADMGLKQVIPTPTAVLKEGLIVLGGVLIAAYVISRFPKVRQFVSDSSITVKDSYGNILF